LTGENVFDEEPGPISFIVSYEQALEAAQRGKQRVLESGAQFSRPEDYFAEMVKTDDHMEKIRRHLLEKQFSMKRIEEAQKQRHMKKFGKKVQRERLEEHARYKKREMEKIRKLRGKFILDGKVHQEQSHSHKKS
jgi:rRNA-processing protein EBP2